MGVSWGNVWFKCVHHDVFKCGVYMDSKYPSPLHSYSDRDVECFLPVVDGYSFVECESESAAIKSVRIDILTRTQKMIEKLMCLKTTLQCEFEYDKWINKNRCIHTEALILDTDRSIKELKRLRRRRPPEFVFKRI